MSNFFQTNKQTFNGGSLDTQSKLTTVLNKCEKNFKVHDEPFRTELIDAGVSYQTNG